MIFEIKFKKCQLVFHCENAKIAKRQFLDNFPRFSMVFSSKYGNHLTDFKNENHLVYSMEIFKRGNHKGKNKKYVFTYYFIPNQIFNFVKIDQKNRYFKIIPKQMYF